MRSTVAASITLTTDPRSETTLLDVEAVSGYIADKGGRYNLDTIKKIVQAVNKWTERYQISPRIVMAQILHETGFFRFGGDVQWWQFNFAGLGATGRVIGHSFTYWKYVPQNVAIPIPMSLSETVKMVFTPKVRDEMIDWDFSIEKGVGAVVQHHAVYLYGSRDRWPMGVRNDLLIDPRYNAVLSAGLDGKVSTVEEYGGKWAVPGTNYGKMIVEIANQLKTQEMKMPSIRPYVMSIPLRVSHAPWGNPNRPGTKALASGRGYITIHETGNRSVGANAEMHRKFVHNGGGSSNVSFNYVVDDREAIELIPRGEKTWQASDGINGPGNSSVSIETCVNSDGNWAKTLNNLVELVVYLLTNDSNLSPDRIVQHNHWARDGKNCPTIMRSNGGDGWNHFIAKVRILYNRQIEPEKPPVPARDPNALEVNGFWIINEMLHRWEGLQDNTLPLIGYPLSRMDTFIIDGVERKAQIFERGVLAIYEEGTPDGVPKDHPFHVRMLTLHEQDSVITQAIEEGIIEPFE